MNGKDINLTIKESIFSKKIVGDIGGEPVDLKASESWGGYNIKGKFKDKDINVKLDSKFVGYKLSSDNMSLRIKNKKLFGNDIKVEGTYNEDPELIPLLLDAVYNLQEEEMIMALVIA
ncbi:unknown [Clostridium sp. CAG:813]|nr:unknown [Clostridium sp. CAG:813]